MRCRKVIARLDAYLDGELEERDRQAVQTHLAACESCRRRHDQLARQAGMIESLPRVTPSPQLRGRIMAALPERPARQPRRARVVARRGVLVGAAAVALASVIAGVLLLTARAPDEQRLARPPSPHATIRQPEAVAPRVEEGSPPVETPETVTPESPAKKTPSAPEPEPTEPAETPQVLAQEYRELGADYEQQGQLAAALEAYQQADLAEETQTASVDVARVYERMGYTADAADRYADLAFASVAVEVSNHNGG